MTYYCHMTATVSTLREKHTAATRSLILDAAFKLLTNDPESPFSHEAVALRSGVGTRTVYRYFPTQADLFQSLWELLRERVPTPFPSSEAEITSLAPKVFESFDQNHRIVRALLSSPGGTQVRERGGAEGRAAFGKSLARDLAKLNLADQKRKIAVFVAVYSAPFWQLLRDRGRLSGPDAQAAVTWTLKALLAHLRRN